MLTGPTGKLTTLLEKHLKVDSNCIGTESLPDLTFVIDSEHYTMTKEDYVMSVDREGNDTPYSYKGSGC